MSPATKMSVVLPVRNNEDDIAQRVEQVLDALCWMTQELSEIIVVDDGSRDATADVLDNLETKHDQVRVIRHSRPRGLEAAGQTGLERAKGELVFIQESNTAVRIDDMHQLHQMSRDHSIVAARAESTPRPLAPSLLRRLRAWGTDADQRFAQDQSEMPKTSMQMIRRPHMQTLATAKGEHYRLERETRTSTKIQRR